MVIACITTGILLCPILSAKSLDTPQTDPNAAQKAASAQVPKVMEADPSAQYLEIGFQRLYELNFDGARVEFFSLSEEPPG